MTTSTPTTTPPKNCPPPTWLLVTPEMAREWTGDNERNRDVRASVVKALAREMKLGQWRTSHHGVCISEGKAIDGQHRLLAIAQTGIPQWMLVCFWDDIGSAFDLGCDLSSKRTIADLLDERSQVIAPITWLARIYYGRSVSPGDVAEIAPAFNDDANALIDACSQTARGSSSSPVVAAATLAMVVYPAYKPFVLDQYPRLVKISEGRAPGIVCLYRSLMDIKSSQSETFCKAWKAFTDFDRVRERLSIKDIDVEMARNRDLIRSVVNRYLDSRK